MNPNKSISRTVQELKNTTLIGKLSNNDSSYENVYKCQKKGDIKNYVYKTINPKYFNPFEFVVPVLMKDNPHFVPMQNFIYNRNGDIYKIMDHVADGDLFELVKRTKKSFIEHECRKIIFTLVNALNDLHQHRLIHNDIKLENLLYNCTKKRLLLCDYGLVRMIDTPSMYDGTTVYFSPEKIQKQPYNPSFDWWAVGVVAYEMLSGGMYPYHKPDEDTMQTDDEDGDEYDDDEITDIEPEDLLPLLLQPLEIIPNVSKKAFDFVSKMLSIDLSKRLSTYDLIVKHPFLKF